MSFEAWFTLGTVAAVFLVFAFTRVPPYLVLLGGLVVLVVAGSVSPQAALAGFANEGMMTIAALFIVAAGLNESGVVTTIVQRFLGRPTSTRGAQSRLVFPVTVASAFLNNTPIVAMLMPVVADWAKRIRVSPSQLLIPLSYAAILGGMCTLIGTSTNLVVHGMLIDSGNPGLGLFDITRVGLPCALIGLLFLVVFGPLLLPRREDVMEALEDPREYTLEMVVEQGGPLVGRTIEDAGLRHLPGVYLMEIHRRGRVRPVVGPQERLDGDDQLIFVGLVNSVVDLQKIPGLKPAPKQLFKLESPRSDRWFVEAVISPSCPLVGKTIRDSHFRNRYNAVVIAVARHGHRIRKRIGDIIITAGDVLLLEALPAFVEQHRNSRDFYLVSRIEGASPPRHERAWAASTIVVAMVVVAAVGVLTMFQAAAAAAAAMLLTRCCSEETARRRVDWQLLITIAAAFGLGYALDLTGAARWIAERLLSVAGSGPTMQLAVVYGIAMAMSAVITNSAAAVLVFPIAMATASNLGVSHMPFVIAIMVAASASFATPLGYQTNLMVYGAGGYRFGDFVRIGLPLSLLIWVATVWITPRVWPF